jgi:hypothetical protein
MHFCARRLPSRTPLNHVQLTGAPSALERLQPPKRFCSARCPGENAQRCSLRMLSPPPPLPHTHSVSYQLSKLEAQVTQSSARAHTLCMPAFICSHYLPQLAALNKAAEAAAAKAAKSASASAPPSPAVAWTNISKYAFEAGDYSSKKVTCAPARLLPHSAFRADPCLFLLHQVTIYITLASVGSLPKENVKVYAALARPRRILMPNAGGVHEAVVGSAGGRLRLAVRV